MSAVLTKMIPNAAKTILVYVLTVFIVVCWVGYGIAFSLPNFGTWGTYLPGLLLGLIAAFFLNKKIKTLSGLSVLFLLTFITFAASEILVRKLPGMLPHQ